MLYYFVCFLPKGGKMDKLVKSFDFKIEQKGLHEDDDVFTFEGFASTFGNIDRDGDIIVAGAFTDTIKEMIPALLWPTSLAPHAVG